MVLGLGNFLAFLAGLFHDPLSLTAIACVIAVLAAILGSAISIRYARRQGRTSPWQWFWVAFTAPKHSEKEHHALYNTYERWAESIKITIQMLIGYILGIAVLLDGAVILVSSFNNPSVQWIEKLNPLVIIAYGLFFSTGVDLAYMLFTPGPDEAIEPVVTGLAAAILLGVGNIDYKHLQLEYGIILFLAIAGLAGLFATRKFLFHPSKAAPAGTGATSTSTGTGATPAGTGATSTSTGTKNIVTSQSPTNTQAFRQTSLVLCIGILIGGTAMAWILSPMRRSK